MSNLEAHAEQELRAAGMFDNDSDYGGMAADAVMELVKTFAKQGHSGASAGLVLAAFGKVAGFQPLVPLTGADDEWFEYMPGKFQNKRCNHVFKDEDGRAYDIDGKVFREPSGSCYTSQPASRVYITFPYTPKVEYVDVPADGTAWGNEMNVNLEDFVRESNRIEGIRREPTDAELQSTEDLVKAETLTIVRVKAFVTACQPNAILRNKPGLDVRVGPHTPPPGGPKIEDMLRSFLEKLHYRDPRDTPFLMHVYYETLHPFTDGNGRSGRAIWLWHMKGNAPLGFLHHWYYQSLQAARLFE